MREVHKLKKVLKIAGIIVLALLVIIAGYAVYLFGSYHRIEDNQSIEPYGGEVSTEKVPVGKQLAATSWNIGFAA